MHKILIVSLLCLFPLFLFGNDEENNIYGNGQFELRRIVTYEDRRQYRRIPDQPTRIPERPTRIPEQQNDVGNNLFCASLGYLCGACSVCCLCVPIVAAGTLFGFTSEYLRKKYQ